VEGGGKNSLGKGKRREEQLSHQLGIGRTSTIAETNLGRSGGQEGVRWEWVQRREHKTYENFEGSKKRGGDQSPRTRMTGDPVIERLMEGTSLLISNELNKRGSQD